jgi:hypothetical protein
MTLRPTLAALCLSGVLALSACDSADTGADSADLTFSVSSATAQQAEVSLDGRALGTVALPWSTSREGATFSLAASSSGDELDVTVRRGTATVKRASGQRVVLSGDATDDDIEIEGSIDALDLDASTLTVSGLTFSVTDATAFKHADGLADFAVGDRVEVDGYADADGTLLASEVERDDDGNRDDDEVEVEGAIEGLTDAEITVSGLTFALTDATELDGFDTLADLAVGDRVEVEGYVDADGALVASQIEREDDHGHDDHHDGDHHDDDDHEEDGEEHDD